MNLVEIFYCEFYEALNKILLAKDEFNTSFSRWMHAIYVHPFQDSFYAYPFSYIKSSSSCISVVEAQYFIT